MKVKVTIALRLSNHFGVYESVIPAVTTTVDWLGYNIKLWKTYTQRVSHTDIKSLEKIFLKKKFALA